MKGMNKKILKISIFILSFVSLIISLKLFWNMGVYVDEYNTTPSIIYGGKFWNLMDWIRLVSNLLICILSLINVFRKN